MTDLWEERKKALENQYFLKKERQQLEQLKAAMKEELAPELCRNRCPKCGRKLEVMSFREVPLDQCPGCGGIWLGPRDLQILSQKDHRSWFDKWFRSQEEPIQTKP